MFSRYTTVPRLLKSILLLPHSYRTTEALDITFFVGFVADDDGSEKYIHHVAFGVLTVGFCVISPSPGGQIRYTYFYYPGHHYVQTTTRGGKNIYDGL